MSAEIKKPVDDGRDAHIAVWSADLRTVLAQRVQHSHIRDGRWDADGRPCQECGARARLHVALGDPCMECGEPFEPDEPVTLKSRRIPSGPVHVEVCGDEPVDRSDASSGVPGCNWHEGGRDDRDRI